MKRTDTKLKQKKLTPASISEDKSKKSVRKTGKSADSGSHRPGRAEKTKSSAKSVRTVDARGKLKVRESSKKKRREAEETGRNLVSQKSESPGKSPTRVGTSGDRRSSGDSAYAKRKKSELDTSPGRKSGFHPKKYAKKRSAGTREKTSIDAVAGLKSRARAKKRKKATEPPSFKNHAARPLAIPEEVQENEMLVIAVDPDIIYASWAIRTEDFPDAQNTVILRVRDVTGSAGAAARGRALIAAPVRKRVGVDFLDLNLSGRDVIVEIGTLDARGRFRVLVRSNRVSVPESRHPAESGASPWMPGIDAPHGY